MRIVLGVLCCALGGFAFGWAVTIITHYGKIGPFDGLATMLWMVLAIGCALAGIFLAAYMGLELHVAESWLG